MSLRSLVERIPLVRNDIDFSGSLKYRRWAGWTAAVFHITAIVGWIVALPVACLIWHPFPALPDNLTVGFFLVMGSSGVFMVGTFFFLGSWS